MSFPSSMIALGAHPYYRLGESSGTNADDASSSPIDGTYSGSGVTYGQTGQVSGDADTAVVLDGSAGLITVSSSTPAGLNKTTFSFAAWVKPTNTSLLFKTLVSAGDTGNSGWKIVGAFSGFGLRVLNETTNESITCAADISSQNVWAFLVVSVSGTTVAVYVNGVAQSLSGSWSASIASYSGTPFIIGARNDGAQSWEGGIDEAAFFPDVALSESQALALYNASTATAPDAPSNLSATQSSTTAIDLTWDDNASDETGFAIGYKQSTAEDFTGESTTTAAANAESKSITGLTEGLKYWFRVKATGASGDSAYATADSAWTKPSVPTINSVSSTEDAISINVTKVSTAATHIQFQYVLHGAGFGSPIETVTVAWDGSSGISAAPASDLTLDAEYDIRFRNAVNTDSYSDWTATESFTVADPASGSGSQLGLGLGFGFGW